MSTAHSAMPNLSKQEALLLKVCGMRETDNIQDLVQLQPEWMGFIFFPKSVRYAEEVLTTETIKNIPATVKKVGVFVNEQYEIILEKVNIYHLDAVQLHGEESPELCRKLRSTGNLTVIKAFSVDDAFDFKKLSPYEETCHYYLFDTKGKQYGGNGTTFNWDILANYTGQTPFFLSGGLDLEHAAAIKNLNLPLLKGLDINSCFELRPGLKDINKVKSFIEKIRS